MFIIERPFLRYLDLELPVWVRLRIFGLEKGLEIGGERYISGLSGVYNVCNHDGAQCVRNASNVEMLKYEKRGCWAVLAAQDI
jgi:hypothetical protein